VRLQGKRFSPLQIAAIRRWKRPQKVAGETNPRRVCESYTFHVNIKRRPLEGGTSEINKLKYVQARSSPWSLILLISKCVVNIAAKTLRGDMALI